MEQKLKTYDTHEMFFIDKKISENLESFVIIPKTLLHLKYKVAILETVFYVLHTAFTPNIVAAD